jgi:E3 ubiquitin-protein ligase Mdm2
MGLCRLQIEAILTEEDNIDSIESEKPGAFTSALLSLSLRKNSNHQSSEKKIRRRKIIGWISESLNPLSGQTGPIVQPISLPVPALFRVVLPDGAVIRSGVELSSGQIGHAPCGSVLYVVGRAFSQHPTDRCIQRLKLAGGGGWVSVKLNRPPPAENSHVIEQIGIDGNFDPNDPGLYHINKQLVVIDECKMNIKSQSEEERRNMASVRKSLGHLESSCISSINDEEDNNSSSSSNDGIFPSSALPTLYRSGVASFRRTSSQVSLQCGSKARKDDPSLICLTEERNATIVHGETGHIACCLTCARLLKGRGDKCPVCRLPIDLIIQQFWA